MRHLRCIFIVGFIFITFFMGCGPNIIKPKETFPPSKLPSSILPLPSPKRMLVFVSDLHMGVGKINGKWSPLEDFRWHQEFDDFLHSIDKKGDHEVDLIMIGDIFELWQSLNKDCDHSNISKNLGCTENEAVARVKRITEQHTKFFDDLSWFASQGENRVTIVPGNHDVSLYFKKVQKEILNMIPDSDGRVRIATEGYWRSSDGLIVAEHGQQIGEDPSKFLGWPTKPVYIYKGNEYLVQPFGEQIVQEFYNDVEEKLPLVDNISEEVKGVQYGAKIVGFKETISVAGDFVRFLLTQTSFKQLAGILGENGIPVWDIQKTRELYKNKKGDFLIESFSKNESFRNQITIQRTQGVVIPSINDLSNDEIITICNRRWALIKGNPKNGVSFCPSTGKLSFGTQTLLDKVSNSLSRKNRYRSYLRSLRDALPKADRPTNKFQIYVYGHTHKVEYKRKYFKDNDAFKPVIFNDGAWQRTITPEQLCNMAKKKAEIEKIPLIDALKKISLEDLPACYPSIIIKYYDGIPEAELNYWVAELRELRSSCPSIPKEIFDEKCF